MKWFLAAVPLVLLFAQQNGGYKGKQETIPGPPIKQPIAYSHKTHIAAGLQCKNCHTIPGEGFLATFPKESFCMGCHQNVKTDSPEIQKLAKFAKDRQPVPWNRVYRVPDMVWFSHALHVQDAGLDCQECHGDVKSRDVLFQEKSISMNSCMECHARMQASNGCDVCHPAQ
jgi:hypothetical protein